MKSPSQNLHAPTSPTQVAVDVLRLEAKAILDCATRLEAASGGGDSAQHGFESAVKILDETLKKGGKIVVTGVGKSGKIAQKISATFASTGSFSLFLHPTEALHGDLGVVQEQDCILALSYTGNTEELLKLIPSFKKLGVPIIGLGGKRDSQLAKFTAAWIDGAIDQEACPHNLAPTTSTTLALALGDALAVALMKVQNFDAEDFAKNHPGGALGKRLTLRVADVMHKENAVAVLPPEASMDQIILALTQKKLGIVLIADASQQLLGIVTDGDLRRALSHRESFFGLKAVDIMTRKPATIAPDALAWQALELMENRPSQIAVLPVVQNGGDSTQKWIGVVRLHDLVSTL